ncbi:hypothetical protein IKF15_04220 [Candidatus Saccharibacteria bacterium]|nr:hypothetical protein [Candidatus Saccharibacteria bacterium]
MFELTEDFLAKVGLTNLPENQKADFLSYAQDQLEVRIGEKMSHALTESQLDEFEKIIDNEPTVIQSWLSSLGDYRNDEVYAKIRAAHGAENPEMLNDFVTAKWLNKNCPQYTQIIESSFNELVSEISSQKDAILANA